MLAWCFVFAACSGDPATFVSYGQKYGSGAAFDPSQPPRRTDALALNYANSVEEIFRARSTGARYTREASDTALAGLAAFTAAAKSLDIGTAKLARMGLASAGILELRTIFDAKGRSTAYFEAAERIHRAIKDYGAYNLNNVSSTHLTPNGWTLVNVVQSNIDIVSKILNGHLPTPQDLAQASEAMSPKGAMPQAMGSEPANNIPANYDPAVAARVDRALSRAVRQPDVVSAEAFEAVKKERDRLLANQPEDIDFTSEVLGIQQDPVLSPAQKEEIFKATVRGAGLAETVKPDASSLATYFQDTASADEKMALRNAFANAKKKMP